MEIKWSEEQKAVFDARGNVLVSASAGSGKTTVMIEKILRLIEEGQDLRRILVMTFSRASAMDMKSKLVEKMYARLSFGKETELIRKQLENVPFANICTINSFCYTLAKRYFSVAGIDPSCSILDEKEQETLLDESLERTIKKQLEKGDPVFLRTLEYFSEKRSVDGIKKVIKSIRGFVAVQEDPEGFLSLAKESTIERAERYFIARMRIRLTRFLLVGREILREKAERGYDKEGEMYRDIVLRLERAGEGDCKRYFSEILGMDVAPKNPHINDAKKGLIDEEHSEKCGRFLTELRAFKRETEEKESLYKKGDSSSQIKEKILELYQENEKEYALRKKQRAVIDFNDAERAALSVLQNEELRGEIKKSFDYVFVDEYQDTNYLQEALLTGLCRNNLFVVGDVKQAIYHFRYAEPEIFSSRKKRYDNMGEGVNRLLNDNYRSCEGVLTFTNEICAEVMTDLFGGVDYRTEAMLRSGLKKECEDAVRIYTYSEEDKKSEPLLPGQVYRVKTAPKVETEDKEAVFIASQIEKLHEEGRKYEDFAVLFKRRKPIPNVIKELEKRKIPYYVQQDKKSILPERETIIDCLRLLLNDYDDIATVNVMTEMFGLSREELLQIRLSHPDLTFSEAVESSDSEKAKRFLQRMERWRFDAEYMTVAELMREILKDGYDAVLLRKGVIAQINAFILFAEQQAERMSVGEFVRYYDTVYDGNVTPAPPSAVTLITQHGSKGLEFPIVFLPYASAPDGGGGRKSYVSCDRELGMEVQRFEEEGYRSEKTFSLYVMDMKKKAEEKESDLRLAYVAFTRAKEKLIIIGKEKTFDKEAQEGNCLMDWLLFAAQQNGKVGEYFFPLPETEGRVVIRPPVPPKRLDLSRLEKKYPFEEATKTYAKTSVSGILKEQEPGVRTLLKRGEEAEIGTAMHNVLRYIDFSVETEEQVAFETERMVKEGLLTAEERDLVDCKRIAETLRAPEMAQARVCPCFREYPFISYLYPHEGATDKVLVQGVVDLLVLLPGDTFMLIDYKMSNLGPQKLKERYTEQIELYKNAVESILKKPVSVAYLMNIKAGYSVRL